MQERASTTYSSQDNRSGTFGQRLDGILSGHLPQVVLESLSLLLNELPRKHLNILHTVDAKCSEVLAQLAPCGERPHAAPEVERQRPNIALTALTIFAGVGEGEDAPVDAGFM